MNILLTTKALTPGKLLANPHTTRPMVLPIPITDTRNIAVEALMPANWARSVQKNRSVLLVFFLFSFFFSIWHLVYFKNGTLRFFFLSFFFRRLLNIPKDRRNIYDFLFFLKIFRDTKDLRNGSIRYLERTWRVYRNPSSWAHQRWPGSRKKGSSAGLYRA